MCIFTLFQNSHTISYNCNIGTRREMDLLVILTPQTPPHRHPRAEGPPGGDDYGTRVVSG